MAWFIGMRPPMRVRREEHNYAHKTQSNKGQFTFDWQNINAN